MTSPGAQPTAPAPPPRAPRRGSRRWITPVAWIVATAAVAFAFRAVGARRALAALAGADVRWLAAAVLANLAIIALWAWQTWLLLPRAGGGPPARFGRVFEVQALTATATNTIPALLGHAAGVALLAERAGIGSAAALSVLTQHQAVEGLAKLAMLGAAALAAPLPPWMRASLAGLAGVVLSLIAVLLFVAQRATVAPAAPAATAAAGAPAEGRGARIVRLHAFFLRWAAGLEALRSPSRFLLALLSALLMKGAEALGWVAVERAFAPALPDALPGGSSWLALSAVSLASAASATPGNVGLYELAATEAYRRLGVGADVSLALAVAGHVAYLIPLVGTGYALLTARELARLARSARARGAAARG